MRDLTTWWRRLPVWLLGSVVLGAVGLASAEGASGRPERSRVVIVRVAGEQSAEVATSFKPFRIKTPENLSSKAFTNRATLDVEILRDGQVGTVKVVKSTGVSEVDEQVRAGVKGWRFPKGKQKLYLYLTLVIEFR